MMRLVLCTVLLSMVLCKPTPDQEDTTHSIVRDYGYTECHNNVEPKEIDDKIKPIDDICAKYECPRYEKLNSTGCGYETRKIYGATWVGTDLDDITDMEKSNMKAFWKLFRYIRKGANNKKAVMDMTVPVMYKWFLDEKYKLTKGRMHFYIPAAYQQDTPLPTEPGVKLYQFGDAVTYDRAFGGDDVSPERYTEEFMKLYSALSAADITPGVKYSVTLGYTRPGWGDQRMEVMYVDANDA